MGHSCLLPSFSIFLRGDEIKRIAAQLRDGEDLRITVGEGHKIEAVDTHHKYSKEEPS